MVAEWCGQGRRRGEQSGWSYGTSYIWDEPAGLPHARGRPYTDLCVPITLVMLDTLPAALPSFPSDQEPRQ